MEKIFIKNRAGQKLAVIVERPAASSGLAFVMHGLGGFKEQPHIIILAERLLNHGYTTVRFDTTNTVGESDGQYEDATASGYYRDLEDVIAWAQLQPWYQAPLVLAGHSLGGLATALFAEKHPSLVKALAPISTVVTGKATFESDYYREILPEWKRTGWRVSESRSKPGVIKRLKYSFVEDALRYDLLPDIDKLTMPVFLAVGEKDASTTPASQKPLFDGLKGPKEIHLIRNAEHTFREASELEELRRAFDAWLNTLD